MSDSDESWERFVAAPHTLGPDPGVREAWRRSRPTYAVWVLRVPVRTIQARMAEVATALGGAVAPVAPEDAHVTAFVAGFPAPVPLLDDDVAESVLAAQRGAVAGLGPVRLEVGGASAFTTCAVLEVHDVDGRLAALRRRLQAVARELRFAPYQAHVTVGRFVDRRPTGPLAAALAPWRAAPPVAVVADAVELVEVDAALWDAPLRTRWRVPLGQEDAWASSRR